MSVIEKFMTKFVALRPRPKLTSFSKFKYYKQDRSNGYFCKQIINLKLASHFKIYNQIYKKTLVTFLEFKAI